jgi:hypothetical protein
VFYCSGDECPQPQKEIDDENTMMEGRYFHLTHQFKSWPMLYIINTNKCVGVYNLQYFSAAVLVSLIFQTLSDDLAIGSFTVNGLQKGTGKLTKILQ